MYPETLVKRMVKSHLPRSNKAKPFGLEKGPCILEIDFILL